MVFDIRRYSIHDGPGIRTTVFFKGCPLHCSWCHNPESQSIGRERLYRERRCLHCGACVSACGHGAISIAGGNVVTDAASCTLCGDCVTACFSEAREIVGREMTVAQVMAEVERDVAFYDESGGGVTLSGGEPLMQPAFCLELLRACKEHEIHTALDTCGYASREVLDRVRPFVDLFLYDVKLMDEAEHERDTGMSNRLILENLRALAEHGHNIILRLPLIPGITDAEDNVRRIGRLAAELPGVRRVDLLPYHHTAVEKYDRLERDYGLRAVRPPTEEQTAGLAHMLRGFGLEVHVGG